MCCRTFSQPCGCQGRYSLTSPPNRRGSRKRRQTQIADDVMPGAQHVIEYHVVTRGQCWITLVGDTAFEPVSLSEGDIAVMPQGDPHVVWSAPGMHAEPNLEAHRRPEDANALPFAIKSGGDGPSDTHLICGFFSCDARPFNLLDLLPRFMRFSRAASQNHTVCSTSSSDWPPPKPAISGPAARAFSTDFRN